MKKILFILFSFVLILTVNSCREDGEWGNDNGGQFGFTIERDNEFIEKAVGEENQLKFNIKPNYNFSTVKTVFKFTTNLNGVLQLNGEVLKPNQEYTFSTEQNIFKYVGNVSGSHELKINVKNDKGASKEEIFLLPYAVSEFTHTKEGGTGPIYQGVETMYLMKVIPGPGQATTDYQIKFNTYNGEVKFNGVAAELGKWYNIVNIDSFTTSLKTNVAGQGKLTYTIKNSTLSKDYEIQQTIVGRQISIESLNFSPANIAVNTQISLSGVIVKSPENPNTSIQYKTWISSASNSNMNGIQNTNNVYMNYALGSNGSFLINISALAAGTYTYNVQVKDEYGNESAVKSLEIVVTAPIYFDDSVDVAGHITMRLAPPAGGWKIYQQNFSRKFKMIAGGNATITAVKYELDYDISTTNSSIHVSRTYNENISPGTKIIERNNEIWQTLGDQVAYIGGANPTFHNVKMKITGTASTGETVSITIEPTMSTIIN